MAAIDHPLISVALCTFNGENFLAEQLDSLLAQDYPSLEFVIADDSSSDRTWELICAYAARDPRIRAYRSDVNLGLVRNFERVLGLCRGAYIAPCDQDDIWAPHKLSVLHEAIGSASLVYCDSELVDAQGHSRRRKISDQRNMYAGHDPVALALANCIAGHAMLLRRDLLDMALPFPSVPYHDWWLAFIAAGRDGIRYVPQPLVRYRRHAAAFVEHAARAAPDDRLRRYEQLLQWLAAVARHPGPEQTYLGRLYAGFRAVADSWFSLELARLLWARRRTLFFIDRRAARKPWRTLFSHALGIPVRQVFSRRYPRRAPQLPAQ